MDETGKRPGLPRVVVMGIVVVVLLVLIWLFIKI
jgi:hypothetical protein